MVVSSLAAATPPARTARPTPARPPLPQTQPSSSSHTAPFSSHGSASPFLFSWSVCCLPRARRRLQRTTPWRIFFAAPFRFCTTLSPSPSPLSALRSGARRRGLRPGPESPPPRALPSPPLPPRRSGARRRGLRQAPESPPPRPLPSPVSGRCYRVVTNQPFSRRISLPRPGGLPIGAGSTDYPPPRGESTLFFSIRFANVRCIFLSRPLA